MAQRGWTRALPHGVVVALLFTLSQRAAAQSAPDAQSTTTPPPEDTAPAATDASAESPSAITPPAAETAEHEEAETVAPAPAAPPAAAEPTPAANAESNKSRAPVRPFVRPEVLTEKTGPNFTPAYVLFSVAGVSAGGALLTGVFASTEYRDLKKRCAPACSDADVANARTLADLSTVLTAAAVGGAALGVIFWLSTPDVNEEPPSQLGVDVRLQPSGAAAEARWAF